MGVSRHVVRCAVCGQQFALPSGADVARAHCTACGTATAIGNRLADYVYSAPVVSPAAPRKPPLAHNWRTALRPAALTGLLWGLCGAVVFGVVAGLACLIILGGDTASSALWAGIDFGLLTGFLLGFIWGFNTKFDASAGVAAAFGGLAGLLITLVHYFGEWAIFTAQPDDPAYIYGIMGFGGGAFAGWVGVIVREWREEA